MISQKRANIFVPNFVHLFGRQLCKLTETHLEMWRLLYWSLRAELLQLINSKIAKIGGVTQKIGWGQLLFLHLGFKSLELPRPIAVKLFQITGNMLNFKSYVQNLGAPRKTRRKAQVQKLTHNLAYYGK